MHYVTKRELYGPTKRAIGEIRMRGEKTVEICESYKRKWLCESITISDGVKTRLNFFKTTEAHQKRAEWQFHYSGSQNGRGLASSEKKEMVLNL